MWGTGGQQTIIANGGGGTPSAADIGSRWTYHCCWRNSNNDLVSSTWVYVRHHMHTEETLSPFHGTEADIPTVFTPILNLMHNLSREEAEEVVIGKQWWRRRRNIVVKMPRPMVRKNRETQSSGGEGVLHMEALLYNFGDTDEVSGGGGGGGYFGGSGGTSTGPRGEGGGGIC